MRVKYAYLPDGSPITIDEYKDNMRGLLKCEHGHEIIIKQGSIKLHHFSHKSNCSCNKGEWHTKFQERIHESFREFRMERDGRKHIADIYVPREYLPVPPINTHGYVIEYQHSHMNKETMRKRESFYTRVMGCHLVWVFDCHNWTFKSTGINAWKKISGPNFPLLASHSGPITLIFDLGRKHLLKVSAKKGMCFSGTPISLSEFDNNYLGHYSLKDNDVRPFHRSL